MFKIPFNHIADKVAASRHLSTGLRFIEEICNDLVVPNGLAPVIAGGAVRDVLVKETDPHDVDIFIVRGSQSMVDGSMQLLVDNLYAWLEDRDIEWRSLVNDRSTAYSNNDNSYLEILDFTFEGINIQVMVPTVARSMDSTVDRFPLMCRGILNKAGMYFTGTGLCAMSFNRPVIVNERDLRYCQKKYPDQEAYIFSSGNELYYNWLSIQETQSPLIATRIPTTGATFSEWPRTNMTAERFRALIRQWFDLEETIPLANESYASDLGGDYTSNRRRAARVTATSTTTTTTRRVEWQW